MILLFGGEKGGTGKTTIATNIAALLSKRGNDVLLIDTDKQASASYWCALREDIENTKSIPCVQKFGNSILHIIKDLSKRYDDVIIDAGGQDSVELRSALSIADKVYIPLQASQFDVWTLGTMDQLVDQAKAFNPNLESYVVINRASPNPSVNETKETLLLFEDLRHLKLCEEIIKDRIAYRKAAKNGLCVTELNPIDTKAAEEMSNLFNEVCSETKNKDA